MQALSESRAFSHRGFTTLNCLSIRQADHYNMGQGLGQLDQANIDLNR